MFGPSAINLYKISVISEETGDAVVPTKEIDGGTFSTELSAGSYTVIVQGTHTGTSFYELGRPIVMGRKNSVTVKAGETTEAAVTMGDFSFRTYPENINSTYLFPLTYDWGSGKLPQDLVMEGYVFDGWYTDSTFTKKTTEYPDTSDYVNDMTFKYPVAHFTVQTPFPPAGTQGVYYASADGSGEGTSPEGPANISTAFAALTLNDGGTLYLMGDEIELPSFTIGQDVTIIGAGGTNGFGKVTVKGAQGNSQVVRFSGSATYTVKNVIVDGENSKQGISNAGNLSLINCEIINCSGNDGAGICNSGTLNLENTKITGCTATAGNSIYCSKADDATPTVNGVGNEYPDDFYYNNVILPNEYTSTTFPYTPIAKGVFYALNTAAGTGDGSSPENAMAFSNALNSSSSVATYTASTPTLYLLEDINLSSNVTASYNVKIVGAGGNDRKGMVTIKSSANSGTLVTLSNVNCIYTFENVTFDGNEKVQCISNKGNLTLNDCYIQNGLTNTASEGGGITTSGNLTINRCKILSCNNTAPSETGNLDKGYGGGIFCTNGKKMTTQIADSLIEGCSSTVGGGGICIGNNCIFTMTNTKVNSCSASRGGGVLFNSFGRDGTGRNSKYPVSFINCKITNCTDNQNQKSIAHIESGGGTAGYNEDLASTAAWEATKSKFPSDIYSCSFTDDN